VLEYICCLSSGGLLLSQRLTISVPDELYERLQAVKDSLNISQVCQVAIEKQVKLLEIKSMSTDTKEKLIQRLKNTRQEFLEQEREKGADYAAAILESDSLTYRDFMTLKESFSLMNQGVKLRLAYLPEWAREEIQNSVEEQDDAILDEDMFLNGYLSTLQEAWEEVKGEV